LATSYECPGRIKVMTPIILTTGESRHRREVIIPVYDALRRVLGGNMGGIPKRSTAILTNGRYPLDRE
jgi:hypothetical protein